MSKIEVNAVEPQCGTNLTLGASGDTIIIPSGATISNQGTAAGFGPTGAVSWNTTKITADPNPAVTGVGYFADTTSAAFTITLPSSPSAGAVVGIADYANTFATNNITVDRNGSPIGGVADNAILSTNGVSITLVYVDATQGWIITDSGSRSDLPTPEYIVASGGTVTCCGDYKIHTFTSPGTFTVCSVGNPAGSDTIDYLVAAGGAGGGTGVAGEYAGGGGGAGGYRESSGAASGCYTRSPLGVCVSALPVTATGYPVTVGAGGTGGAVPSTAGSNGSNSVFSTIISTGGGGGGRGQPGDYSGSTGGSGGGTSGETGNPGAAGNTPPVSPPQGQPGGDGSVGAPTYAAGGGGGATGAGNPNGTGGVGATSSINGTPTARAGGGGGGGSYGTPQTGGYGGGGTEPTGSLAGAGKGGTNPASPPGTINNGTAASANSASGGGGGVNNINTCGANGGSGIVIIRYKFQ
jgi:hypothetical protein